MEQLFPSKPHSYHCTHSHSPHHTCTSGILSDLFPGVALPELDYDNIRAALIKHTLLMNLQPLESFLDKAIQLYEMIIVRHGLMMVCVLCLCLCNEMCVNVRVSECLQMCSAQECE